MRKRTITAALLIVLPAWGANARVAPVPSCVTALSDSIPDSWRDDPIVILADSTWVEMQVAERGGNSVRQFDVTWYHVNHTSPALLRRVHVFHHEAIEQRPTVSLRAYGANGSGQGVSERDIECTRVTEVVSFRHNKFVHETGSYVTSLPAPLYERGALLRLQVQREYSAPAFVNRVCLRSRYAALVRYVSVSWPAEASPLVGILNPERLPLDTTRVSSRQRRFLTVAGRGLPKIVSTNSCRAPEAWYACLRFSFPPHGLDAFSWRELGDFYLEMIHEAAEPTDETQAIGTPLKGLPRDTILARAFDYMRRTVRYYGDWRDIHAYVPRLPATVLSQGYGDCKEMALVLRQILVSAGLPARLALVNAPGYFQPLPSYPSLGSFNHMVVCTPRRDGAIEYIDPTNSYGDRHMSSCRLAGRRTLMLAPGSSRLDTVNVAEACDGRVHTASTIVPHGTGGWRIEGTIALRGCTATDARAVLDQLAALGTQTVARTLLSKLVGIQAEQASVLQNEPGLVRIGFTAPFTANYITVPEPILILGAPRVTVFPTEFSDARDEGPRYLSAFAQEDRWELPEGFSKVHAPALESPFAIGAWRHEESSVVRTYVQKAQTIPQERRDAYRAFHTQLRKFASATVGR